MAAKNSALPTQEYKNETVILLCLFYNITVFIVFLFNVYVFLLHLMYIFFQWAC